MLRDNLIKLGLSQNEASVYLAVVRLGECDARTIIKSTGLHRNIVYDALESLHNKKLISELYKKGHKVFKLKSPQILSLRAKESLSLAEQVIKEVNQLNKVLAHEVNIYEDKEGWQEAWRNLIQKLKPRTVFYTIGMGADRWVDLMGDVFLEYEQYAVKHKITNKIVAYEYQRMEIAEHQSKIIRRIRYLPYKFYNEMGVEIFSWGIFMEIYASPPTIIEILSPAVASWYKHIFDILWKIAKK